MSSKETTYLLQKENNNGESSSTEELKKPNFGVPIYGGTNLRLVGKMVPLEERILYSWNGINAFGSTVGRTKRKYFCCGPVKEEHNKKKHILKNVNGAAYPGELLAILGSSGAGKTTLLNALTFKSNSSIGVTGTRLANGTPVNSKTLTSQSAYVQQNDLFIGSLTVKEHLTFQSLVRMDKHFTKKQRARRVEEVISELALTKCQDTTIGITGRIKGISGGEKKRLSFAAEVLTNPSLMFCDEPTSGLDSFMALNVIQVLKNLSLTGKTVVCTIHQPSSELYALFDKILLMSEGRVAFLGTPQEANSFFAELEAPCPENYNPADYFVELLAISPDREVACRQSVQMICDKFERSDVGVKLALNSDFNRDKVDFGEDLWVGSSYRSPYKASWLSQFTAILWRSCISNLKEPLLIKVRFIQTVIVSLVIGGVFFGQQANQVGIMNINGAIFFFLTSMSFQNTFAVISVFCEELPIFLRENRNGMYRTDVYFLGKTLADAPVFIIISILFLSICYFLIGLNGQGSRFFYACLIVVLVANCAISFGYLISCLSSNVAMALSLSPPLVIPLLIFGGFFLNVNSIPFYLKWLATLSWFKYGNEALMINQWKDVTNITCDGLDTGTCLRTGHVVLESFSFHEDSFDFDLIGLALVLMGFRLAALLALLVKTYTYEK